MEQSLQEVGIDTDFLATSLHEGIAMDSKVRKALEAKGYDMNKLMDKLIEMLDAQTISATGDPMSDNKAQMDALKMITQMAGFNGTSQEKNKSIKMIMEALGIMKQQGTSINFSFTKFLQGDLTS